MRQMTSVRDWALILVVTSLSGVLYALLFVTGDTDGNGVLIGALYAPAMSAPILAFARGRLFPRLARWVEALPTPIFVPVSIILALVMLNVGFFIAGAGLRAVGLIEAPMRDVGMLRRDVVLYAVVVLAAATSVIRVRQLLGRDVFFSLIIGRYRRPVQEERIFLFLDLVGSTSFAEVHGDLRAQEYLGALFETIAAPIRQARGSIDDYIGDAAIVTWPMPRGLKDGRCVTCVFAILDAIEARRDFWLAEFGAVPRLRAALHGGPVVLAEIGIDHHKITFFGDTVNTTARIETLCRGLDRPVLISGPLLARLTLPEGIEAQDMGLHALRGRDHLLAVSALTRAPSGQAGADFLSRPHDEA